MRNPFVEVIILSPVKTETLGAVAPSFTYHLPDDLDPLPREGSLVVVPFGRRRQYGIVVALNDESPVAKTRPVESLADPAPVLTPIQLELSRWMSREYLAPLHECMTAMLPPGIVGHADVQVTLCPDTTLDAANTEAQAAVIQLLEEQGPLRGSQLDAALPGIDWRPAVNQLARRGNVRRESFLAPPRVSPKTITTARLIPPVDLEANLAGLRSPFYPPIIRLLRAEGGSVDVSRVYAETGCQRYHLNKLAEREVIVLEEEETWRDPLADQVFVPTKPLPLTPDQQAVWEPIQTALDEQQGSVFLLHGVTGSGKTEVYLQAVDQVLAQGRRALILIPEISLTPQTTTRFAARFPDRVTVLHSALSQGERYDTWRRARANLVDVIVGPRSALFSPLSPLGLIVLDEEHDDSYKQEAPRPRYHAREVALKLARLTGATVVLGSATPSLESFHRARQGQMTLLEMPRRIMGHARRLNDLQSRHHLSQIRYHALGDGPAEARYLPLPQVQIVDLRAELKAGNRSIFSRALQEALDRALARGEQAILFLNRRGAATFILCRDCGYVSRCPRCETPLTQHRRHAQLVCHHCNHREPQPSRCPQCQSQRFRYFGLGTERLEEKVGQRWPQARLMRWDRDTARTHAAHANILQQFIDGAADILIGTQMIAKGLDLPLVTVVGIISADTALNLPDFRSGERTFQLLAQVAGRAGRGLLGGHVVLQTYHPDHYAIVAAAGHDYVGFAARELAFRREQAYPPYHRLAKLTYADPSPTQAETEARALVETLRRALIRRGLSPVDLMGPVPAFFARRRGRYRWQILLRHPDPAAFLGEMSLPPGWLVDVDPVSIL